MKTLTRKPTRVVRTLTTVSDRTYCEHAVRHNGSDIGTLTRWDSGPIEALLHIDSTIAAHRAAGVPAFRFVGAFYTRNAAVAALLAARADAIDAGLITA